MSYTIIYFHLKTSNIKNTKYIINIPKKLIKLNNSTQKSEISQCLFHITTVCLSFI